MINDWQQFGLSELMLPNGRWSEMLNSRLWKLELNKILTSKAFLLGFFAIFLLYFIDTGEKILYYSQVKTLAQLRAASSLPYSEWRFLSLILTVFAPFVAGFLCVDNYAVERNRGIYISEVTRGGRSILWVKAVLVFVLTWITFFLPMALSQAAYLFFAPSRSIAVKNAWVYYGYMIYSKQNYHHPQLHSDSPYFSNILAMARTALFFAAMALLMYAVSLFFYRRIWIVILSGGVVYYVFSYLLGTVGFHQLVPMNYFFPEVQGGADRLWVFYCFLSIMITVALALIFIKRTKKKDEL